MAVLRARCLPREICKQVSKRQAARKNKHFAIIISASIFAIRKGISDFLILFSLHGHG